MKVSVSTMPELVEFSEWNIEQLTSQGSCFEVQQGRYKIAVHPCDSKGLHACSISRIVPTSNSTEYDSYTIHQLNRHKVFLIFNSVKSIGKSPQDNSIHSCFTEISELAQNGHLPATGFYSRNKNISDLGPDESECALSDTIPETIIEYLEHIQTQRITTSTKESALSLDVPFGAKSERERARVTLTKGTHTLWSGDMTPLVAHQSPSTIMSMVDELLHIYHTAKLHDVLTHLKSYGLQEGEKIRFEYVVGASHVQILTKQDRIVLRFLHEGAVLMHFAAKQADQKEVAKTLKKLKKLIRSCPTQSHEALVKEPELFKYLADNFTVVDNVLYFNQIRSNGELLFTSPLLKGVRLTPDLYESETERWMHAVYDLEKYTVVLPEQEHRLLSIPDTLILSVDSDISGRIQFKNREGAVRTFRLEELSDSRQISQRITRLRNCLLGFQRDSFLELSALALEIRINSVRETACRGIEEVPETRAIGVLPSNFITPEVRLNFEYFYELTSTLYQRVEEFRAMYLPDEERTEVFPEMLESGRCLFPLFANSSLCIKAEMGFKNYLKPSNLEVTRVSLDVRREGGFFRRAKVLSYEFIAENSMPFSEIGSFIEELHLECAVAKSLEEIENCAALKKRGIYCKIQKKN